MKKLKIYIVLLFAVAFSLFNCSKIYAKEELKTNKWLELEDFKKYHITFKKDTFVKIEMKSKNNDCNIDVEGTNFECYYSNDKSTYSFYKMLPKGKYTFETSDVGMKFKLSLKDNMFKEYENYCFRKAKKISLAKNYYYRVDRNNVYDRYFKITLNKNQKLTINTFFDFSADSILVYDSDFDELKTYVTGNKLTTKKLLKGTYYISIYHSNCEENAVACGFSVK